MNLDELFVKSQHSVVFYFLNKIECETPPIRFVLRTEIGPKHQVHLSQKLISRDLTFIAEQSVVERQ